MTLPLSALAVTALTAAAFAEPPATLDLEKIPALMHHEVVIPVPHEIFASLDKLGGRDWDALIKRGALKVPASRSDQALLFGMVISNGFVAVQAEQIGDVESVGRQVLKLGKALGVEKSVVPHAQSIIDGARGRNWDGVRAALDRTQQTVRDTMERMRDDDIAELVSVGGWLGGTHALAAVLSKSYDEEGAELLRQPALLAHLTKRFFEIPDGLRHGEVPKVTGEALRSLEPYMSAGERVIPEAEVIEVHNMTHDLILTIYGERK